MEVFQDIYIDLYNGNTETISVNQNDNGARKIRCYVQLCGSDWIIPNDVKVNIKVKKPNGYGVYKQIGNDNFGEISKNIITIPITTEMTNCDGRLFCTLEFVSGSDIIHSFMFYIKVNKIAFSNEDIIDTNDYKTILDYVEQAKKYMELSKEYSTDSYNSSINSNRYAENSQSSATAASLSASKSKTSETNAKASETNSATSENNAKTYMKNASTSAITASSKADEALASANSASASENTINIKVVEINQKVNDVESIKSDIQNIASDVSDMRDAVSEDKTTIEDTIKNSLLASSEEILAAMKDYYDRAQELYNSMYIDCDGEIPQQRVVTVVSIDCGTPQSRLHDINGILFNGGTPLNRQLAS